MSIFTRKKEKKAAEQKQRVEEILALLRVRGIRKLRIVGDDICRCMEVQDSKIIDALKQDDELEAQLCMMLLIFCKEQMDAVRLALTRIHEKCEEIEQNMEQGKLEDALRIAEALQDRILSPMYTFREEQLCSCPDPVTTPISDPDGREDDRVQLLFDLYRRRLEQGGLGLAIPPATLMETLDELFPARRIDP